MSLLTQIWIFAIGRGNAAFVRSGLNQGFILDMGGGDMFDPASFIVKYLVAGLDKYRNNTIAQAILSHPHTDHIAQCGRLSKQELLYPTLLTCPSDHKKLASHEQIDWKRLGKRDPEKEELIRSCKGLHEQRTPPVQTILYDSARTIPNLEYGLYYIAPEICDALHPTNDNQYGNALSIVFFLRHGDHTIESSPFLVETLRGS